jgi:hypothetical protein
MNDHDSWVTDSFWGDDEDKYYFFGRIEADEAEEDFGFDTYETEHEPSGRVSKMTTQKLNLEKALKDLARQQDTVQKLLQQAQRFPEEFEVGTVLKFKHVFMKYGTIPVNSTKYDYVALRADNGFWYLTCSGSKTMTWDQLVEFIGDEEVNILVENATV